MKSIGQNSDNNILKPMKIGFLYAFGSNERFFHDDPDYTYKAQILKGQAFYNLGNWKSLNLELIVQPQVQFLEHQLINNFYVTPDQENYQEKIAEFTKKKNMNLYALEFGSSASKNHIYKTRYTSIYKFRLLIYRYSFRTFGKRIYIYRELYFGSKLPGF